MTLPISRKFPTKQSTVAQVAVVLFIVLQQVSGLIITSVIAGDKKFKTISFDSKFLKPLMFEKELPNTEFRRHRTVRPPKFDIDVNIPIKLPLEEEYPQEEYKKPVESNIFFQTGELNEPKKNYNKKATIYKSGQQQAQKQYKSNKPLTYKDEYASASNQNEQLDLTPASLVSQGIKGILPQLVKSIRFEPKIETVSNIQAASAGAAAAAARSDMIPRIASGPAAGSGVGASELAQQVVNQAQRQLPMQQMVMADLNTAASYQIPQQYSSKNNQYGTYNKDPDFIPGGFVNLQLSGPTGGPQMTYEDYDREKWAQQLSQTAGAMPYPILNYHQLQNYYGGLGTFTNGIAEHRYTEHSLIDQVMSGLSHLKSKFHIGRR